MSNDLSTGPAVAGAGQPENDAQTMGSSPTFRLFHEFIRLREVTSREHRSYERKVNDVSEDLKRSFNSFAADTQRAYQQLRQEFHGEKRVGLALLNELLEISQDLDRIVASRPATEDAEAMSSWAAAVEVEARKVQAALLRHGIHPYEAQPGEPYNPALHERVGKARVEGMGPNLVAEVKEPGYASQQPEFVLRRPKVIVSD